MENCHQIKKVIALGFFDGVHIGHAALLRETLEKARALNALPAVLTFDRHPDDVIAGHAVPLINSSADKTDIIRRLFGIDEVIFAHFDDNMMRMPWADFVTGLHRDYNAVHVVAGHDFHFGYKGIGDPVKLMGKSAELGMGCSIIPKVELDGITASSTYIRHLLEHGKVKRANDFLGHPHTMSGTVEYGRKLGSSIGIPTVNIPIPQGVISPAFGVYITKLYVGGKEYFGVTNVGVRPSVSSTGRISVETYILDFSGDLYGRDIRVDFYRRLRAERAFTSVDELKEQIRRDIDATAEYFKTKTAAPAGKPADRRKR